MIKGIADVTTEDLNAELARVLLPRLSAALQSRGPGHCMRVQDLDDALTQRLCQTLRGTVPGALVTILAGQETATPIDPFVSPTKLVELRNPEADGRLRPPLLVFIPSGLRAAAEDSFGVATFEELEVADVYSKLEDALAAALPNGYRAIVPQLLKDLRADGRSAMFADAACAVRFLLTARRNANEPEALGAALFHVGLIPDFEWLDDQAAALARARNNRAKVEKLTWSPLSERGRVQELELKDPTFRNRLGRFLQETGTEDPRQWARRIAMDPGNWGLSFDKWQFVTEQTPDRVFIFDVETNLPVAESSADNPALDALAGQQILTLGGQGLNSFAASFHLEQHPQTVQGLDRFVVQVVAVEGGPIGFSRKKTVWKSKTLKGTVSFGNLGKVAWEEGWHFIRVIAETVDGDPIAVVDAEGRPVIARDGEDRERAPNESDVFYVLPDGSVEIEPVQRAIQRAPGFLHALFKLQFKAVLGGRDPDLVKSTAVCWTDKSSRGTDLLQLQFGRDGIWHVAVSRRLREIEQRILAQPRASLAWHLDLEHDSAGAATQQSTDWPRSPLTQDFLAARESCLRRIEGGGQGLTSEAADFRDLLDESLDYADAFVRLIDGLRHQAETSGRGLADLHALLRLDTVTVTFGDHRGQHRDALILAPTHPIRTLWYALWAQLGRQWISVAKGLELGRIGPVSDALLRYLAPSGFPPVLPVGSGRLFSVVDHLTPFWTLYAPSTESDPRGLLGQVCNALGLPEPGIGGSVIDGDYLATRFERYLAQHPYVATLAINAFNAGRAGVIADALLALQRNAAWADLRYDVRIFAPDAEAPGLADGLAELQNPSSSTTRNEADAFCTPAENHLAPKLAVAVRAIGDYRERPDLYRAHLTLLFDVFAASEVGATRGDGRDGIAPVHGLVLDMAVQYEEDESVVAWRRHPRFGVPLPIGDLEDETRLLTRLGLTLANATADVATGRTGMDLRPQLTLSLSPDDKALLHLVHEHSDWVLTVDRNMGIEYFDHGGRARRPDYLIDHSPDIQQNAGPKLAITSRSLHEVEAMLTPVLAAYDLPTDRSHAVVLLDQLRSLSGRLALKLVSAQSQQAEAMGLALARLFLEDQGVFANQVVVPLDAHLELYRGAKAAADEVGESVSFKRTDLALFDLNPGRREIVCRLVEVKCYRSGLDLFGSASLRHKIAEQIMESEKVLAGHFDLDVGGARRPDHVVKARELTVLLDFYLARAERYGLVTPDAAEEARFFLRTIDEGYRLRFTRTGLVFDFAKDGLDQPEEELGVEFHRIGADRIKALVAAACTRERVPAIAESAAELAMPPARAIEVSAAAAFLSPWRDRTVDWESVSIRLREVSAATIGEAATPAVGGSGGRAEGGVWGTEASLPARRFPDRLPSAPQTTARHPGPKRLRRRVPWS
jgi:DNA phosphorothioation-dependent restriction protein DptH